MYRPCREREWSLPAAAAALKKVQAVVQENPFGTNLSGESLRSATAETVRRRAWQYVSLQKIVTENENHVKQKYRKVESQKRPQKGKMYETY